MNADQIKRRSQELITQGIDPETAMAVAVAEQTNEELAGGQAALERTLVLLDASHRPGPAYLYTDEKRGREKSFGIPFEDLPPEHDSAMATEAWQSMWEFLRKGAAGKKKWTDAEKAAIIGAGEDIVVGAYILTKLSALHKLPDLIRVIQQREALELDRTQPKSRGVLSHNLVSDYLNHCSEFGHNLAVG